jgi:hypothetical protein
VQSHAREWIQMYKINTEMEGQLCKNNFIIKEKEGKLTVTGQKNKRDLRALRGNRGRIYR